LSTRAPQLDGSEAVKKHHDLPPKSGCLAPVKLRVSTEAHGDGSTPGELCPRGRAGSWGLSPCTAHRSPVTAALQGAGESFPAAVAPCASPASTPWSQLSISQGSIRAEPFPAQHGGNFGRQTLLQQGKRRMLQEVRSPLHCRRTKQGTTLTG